MEFIRGAYGLGPVYIDGKLSLSLNEGAIVKENGTYYIIKNLQLEEVLWQRELE